MRTICEILRVHPDSSPLHCQLMRLVRSLTRGFASVQDDIIAECYFERLPRASRNMTSNDCDGPLFALAASTFSAAAR